MLLQNPVSSSLFDPGHAGYDAFQADASTVPTDERKPGAHEDGKFVPLARRGTQLFYVIKNAIRWTDIELLQSQESQRNRDQGNGTGQRDTASKASYKVLSYKSYEPILQLIIDPYSLLLAVVTRFRVTVIILPEHSKLLASSDAPIRVKTHSVGPTTHVNEQAPLAEVLWHPLSTRETSCLLTITTNAVLRLWELRQGSLPSFESPSLAVDLKKIRHNRLASEDYSAGDAMVNRGFTVDDVDMEIKAAAFGGRGIANELVWSSMTLWFVTTGGDIYALCPLVPSTFNLLRPGNDLREFDVDEWQNCQYSDTADGSVQCQRASTWLKETLQREQQGAYMRPRSFPAVPRLQGPFSNALNQLVDEIEPSDLLVIPAGVADGEHFLSTENEERSLPLMSVICLLSNTGRVHLCLDLEGTLPDWLPTSETSHYENQQEALKALVPLDLFETLSDSSQPDDQAPMLCAGSSSMTFYVVNTEGIIKCSISPWSKHLDAEIEAGQALGSLTRMQSFAKGSPTSRSRVMRSEKRTADLILPGLPKPLLLEDEGHGVSLLLLRGTYPRLVNLPDPQRACEVSTSGTKNSSSAVQDLKRSMTSQSVQRSTYTPAEAFWHQSQLKEVFEEQGNKAQQRRNQEEVRLSSATLNSLTKAHRLLSDETSRLNEEAANLFRRCERLREEFSEQINQINNVATRAVQIYDAEDLSDLPLAYAQRSTMLKDRLENVKKRHQTVLKRHADLRSKVTSWGGKAISDEERDWIHEILSTADTVETKSDNLEDRFNRLSERTAEVLQRAEGTPARTNGTHEVNGTSDVPKDIRQARIAQVEVLLEDQSNVIRAVEDRLMHLDVPLEA